MTSHEHKNRDINAVIDEAAERLVSLNVCTAEGARSFMRGFLTTFDDITAESVQGYVQGVYASPNLPEDAGPPPLVVSIPSNGDLLTDLAFAAEGAAQEIHSALSRMRWAGAPDEVLARSREWALNEFRLIFASYQLDVDLLPETDDPFTD